MKRIEVVAAIIIKDGQVFDKFHLNEHSASAWLNRETLRSVNWLPADLGLLDEIEKLLARSVK